MARSLWVAASIGLAISLAPIATLAQLPPQPEGLTTVQVAGHPEVSIAYKETHICETQARAWSGYVHMPSSYLSETELVPYNVSMFFWYFEAREDPEHAPSAIYVSGGPGESGLYGTTSDGGPCVINADSNSTTNNPWSMNTNVNMLYVDQPVGTGFSYDALVKSTQDLLFNGGASVSDTGIVPFEAYGGKVPAENTTFKYGVFPTQNPKHTALTTGTAAIVLWKFAQAWFASFPEWTTKNKRVSMWSNSYGGYWVPASAAYFQKQNVNIKNGAHGIVIELDAIGLTNGCVDMLYQAEWYPQMAYNNTYDFPLINRTIYEWALNNYVKPDGCRDRIVKCRELASAYDPEDFGINKTVDAYCELKALKYCEDYVIAVTSVPITDVSPPRSPFDMAHLLPDPFPTQYLEGYTTHAWVQKELGVPVNFTGNSWLVQNVITDLTGDLIRRAGLKDLEYLLDSGIKVTLAYGDRDQRCPWLGGEHLSLAAEWAGAEAFGAAGYEYVHTNNTYNGGIVRQHGNLSFIRIFEAGHDPAPYQPETVFQIFNRSTFNKDVATGEMYTSGFFNGYSTSGPSSAYAFKTKLPPPPSVDCYLWSIGSTCTQDQLSALEQDKAEIVDYRIVKPAGGGGPIFASL